MICYTSLNYCKNEINISTKYMVNTITSFITYSLVCVQILEEKPFDDSIFKYFLVMREVKFG